MSEPSSGQAKVIIFLFGVVAGAWLSMIGTYFFTRLLEHGREKGWWR